MLHLLGRERTSNLHFGVKGRVNPWCLYQLAFDDDPQLHSGGLTSNPPQLFAQAIIQL